MPAATSEAPAVALSFANNFWGKDDAGVQPLLERMSAAKTTCDELKSFYTARAKIEEEYSRQLLNLSRKSLGSQESGTLKVSLDTVRQEVESMGKQHQAIALQMRSELEEPLVAFAGGMKERRKIIQNTVEKLLKVKVQQTQAVNKTRDRYEQESLKIKGYLAQGHMVMGQEERKNKAKLEKTQISLASSNADYEAAVQALEKTTARWNQEWKGAADKFQDLEEERLDFTKSSLWTFANIASTVCVSDDASCEKIRLSLEKMEVEKDIATFIKEKGTGQEIPDPPKYINFCRGDVDAQSEVSVEPDSDAFSVAQFPRSINPAFRSSSPQPSTYESHHDPNNALVKTLGHDISVGVNGSRETTATPSKLPTIPAAALTMPPQQQQIEAPPPQQQPVPPPQQQQLVQQRPQLQQRRTTQHSLHEEQRKQQQQVARVQQNPRAANNVEYDSTDFIPHSPHPLDGTALLSRPPGPVSSDVGLNAAPSTNTISRPSRRGDKSSEPTLEELQQQLQQSGPVSPVKKIQQQQPQTPQTPLDLVPANGAQSGSASPEKKELPKRKSGFSANNSPFKRKSTKELEQQATGSSGSRQTWYGGQSGQSSSMGNRTPRANASPTKENNTPFGIERSVSPDPIAANASVALNIGGNVFAVDPLDKRKGQQQQQQQPAPDDDPIALALAELKGVTSNTGNQSSTSRTEMNKQMSVRMSADHYHGITTPAPPGAGGPQQSGNISPGGRNASSHSMHNSRSNSDLALPPVIPGASNGTRATPPPSYDGMQGAMVPVSRLGVPPPAVTSRAMKESSQKFQAQTRSLFSNGGSSGGADQRPGSGSANYQSRSRGGSTEIPRAASPRPGSRAASPRPGSHAAAYGSSWSGNNASDDRGYRSASPNPYGGSSNPGSMNSRHAHSQSMGPMGIPAQGQQPRRSDTQHTRHGSMDYRGSSSNMYQAAGGSGAVSPVDMARSVSPSPFTSGVNRPGSSLDHTQNHMQLAHYGPGGQGQPDDGYTSGSSMRGRDEDEFLWRWTDGAGFDDGGWWRNGTWARREE
ncbi:formin-binding protein [Neurospora sp. IMI 360204]|nr:formin-binding protein [Neurospora sp. IMI 360204]